MDLILILSSALIAPPDHAQQSGQKHSGETPLQE